jgi:hypothetical protein
MAQRAVGSPTGTADPWPSKSSMVAVHSDLRNYSNTTNGKRIPGSSIPSWTPRSNPAFKDTWSDAVTESLRTATPSVPGHTLNGPPTIENIRQQHSDLDDNQVQIALVAAMADYQSLNTVVWDLIRSSVDLSGAYEVVDLQRCKERFMIGDLRDGVGFMTWALSLAKTDPIQDQIKALKALNDFPALDGSKQVTRVMLDVHTSRLVQVWSAVSGNDSRQTSRLLDFRARLLMSIPHQPLTSKVVLCRQYLVDAIRDKKADSDTPEGMVAILTQRADDLDMDPGDPGALNVLNPFVGKPGGPTDGGARRDRNKPRDTAPVADGAAKRIKQRAST